MLRSRLPDIVAILVIGLLLTILSEFDRMDLLTRLPFLTLFVPYVIGRYARKRKPAEVR